MNSVLKDGAPRVDEFQRHLSTSVTLAGLAVHGWTEIIGRTWQIIECYCTTFRSSTSEARELLKVFILFLNYFVKFIPYNTMATTPRMRKANEKSAKVRIFLVKPLRMSDIQHCEYYSIFKKVLESEHLNTYDYILLLQFLNTAT